jgi:hypothetical protein
MRYILPQTAPLKAAWSRGRKAIADWATLAGIDRILAGL